MGTAKRRHRSAPWFCGVDSTAIAPIGSARKHLPTKVRDERKDALLSSRAPKRLASSSGEEDHGDESSRKPFQEEEKRGFRSGEGAEVHSQYSAKMAEKSKQVSTTNLAVGASLIFLFVRTATEVNKMMELRTEVEKLLGKIKGPVPDTVGFGNSKTESEVVTPESQDGYLKQHTIMQGRSSSGTSNSLMMEQLEAELELELKRLQLNVGYDEDSASSLHQSKDVGDSINFSLSGMDGESDEDDDHKDDDSRCENGICPRQLERRLYRIRDMQQQQQIAELESELQSVRRTLLEKEMEIQWWRDTNRLVLDTGRNSR